MNSRPRSAGGWWKYCLSGKQLGSGLTPSNSDSHLYPSCLHNYGTLVVLGGLRVNLICLIYSIKTCGFRPVRLSNTGKSKCDRTIIKQGCKASPSKGVKSERINEHLFFFMFIPTYEYDHIQIITYMYITNKQYTYITFFIK